MKNKFFIGVVALVAIAGGGVIAWQNYFNGSNQVACTQEAKLCPDGSYVGRTGPNCEFAACPSNDLWKTSTDTKQGISYQYPDRLLTKYISAQEWPPEVRIVAGEFSCAETPQEVSSVSEITSRRVIDNKTYCVHVTNEGAAGSVYFSSDYTTSMGGKLVSARFVLRFVNCTNYDAKQSVACASEREAFDIDGLIHRIVQSITFLK